MFSLLIKNKFYFLSAIKIGFLNINKLSDIYKTGINKSYNNNVIFSPLCDLLFEKRGFQSSFIYPNKYNVYFKIYNIFSIFRKDMSFYEDNENIYVNSNLVFDLNRFSLRDFISFLINKKDVELYTSDGFGTFSTMIRIYSVSWFSLLEHMIFKISRLHLKSYGFDIEKRYVDLEYYLLRQSITNGFNEVKLYIEKDNLSNTKKVKLYKNVLSNIEKLIFYYLDKNIDDMSINFHLSKRIKKISDMICDLYPIFDLIFFYDKYRKDFILFLDIVFAINHQHPSKRNKFYNSVLMRTKFITLRAKHDVYFKTYLEFYPDSTYNNIDLNVVFYDGEIIKETYKKDRNDTVYIKILPYRYEFKSETDRKEVLDLLKSIDNDMNIIYQNLKVNFFNGGYATRTSLFG